MDDLINILHDRANRWRESIYSLQKSTSLAIAIILLANTSIYFYNIFSYVVGISLIFNIDHSAWEMYHKLEFFHYVALNLNIQL